MPSATELVHDSTGFSARVEPVRSDGKAQVIPLRQPLPKPATAEMFTIKDVADACGLPQPVISQLVPHTDTAAGRLYTAGQLRCAVELAEDFRARRSTDGHSPTL